MTFSTGASPLATIAALARARPEFRSDLSAAAVEIARRTARFGARGSLDPSTIPLCADFVRADVVEEVARVTRRLLSLCESLIARMGAERRIHAETRVGLFGPAGRFRSRLPAVVAEAHFFARPDFLLREGRPILLEMNSSFAAGAAWECAHANSIQTRILSRRPELGRFRLHSHSTLARLSSEIEALSAKTRGQPGDPFGRASFLVLDLEDDGSSASLARGISGEGLPTFYGLPDVLEFDGAALRAKGIPVGFVGRKYIPKFLVEEDSIPLMPLEIASRCGAAFLLGDDLNRLASDKGLLAILASRAASLAEPDRELVERYLPWTVPLEKGGRVHRRGASVSLEDLAAPQWKDEFVLKPTCEEGGRGIVLGANVPAREWSKAMQRALDEGQGGWVLQERICADPVELLVPDEEQPGNVAIRSHAGVYGVYLVRGRSADCLLRFAPPEAGVINAAQGARVHGVLRYGSEP